MLYSVFPLPFPGLAWPGLVWNIVDRGNEGRILKRWPVLYRGGLYKTEHYWFSQKDLYTQKAHSEMCKIPKFGVCRDTAIRTLQNLIKTSVWRSMYSTIWMVVSRLNFTWQKSQTIFKLVVNCWVFNFEKKIIFIQLTYKILKQLSPRDRFKTVDNYWTRSSKISWFVSDEHISYLSKPKTEANTWSARQWQITIFCYKGVQ